MRKFGGFLWIIFLIMLLSPGYAVANGPVSFNLVHPATATVGRTFTVDVNIVSDVAGSLCGWFYTIDYEDTELELIGVAGATPPFLSASENLPPGPMFSCSTSICPQWAPSGQFAANDWTITGSHSTPIPLPGSTTARFTFRALKTGPTDFKLVNNGDYPNISSGVSPSEGLPLTVSTVTGGSIIVRDYPVPALSQNGMLVFMLLLVGSAILFMRRRHNRG